MCSSSVALGPAMAWTHLATSTDLPRALRSVPSRCQQRPGEPRVRLTLYSQLILLRVHFLLEFRPLVHSLHIIYISCPLHLYSHWLLYLYLEMRSQTSLSKFFADSRAVSFFLSKRVRFNRFLKNNILFPVACELQ